LAGLSVVAVAVSSGCAPHYIRSIQPAAGTVSLPQTRLTGRVLVVSIDGLRPDAIGAGDTPTLFP
jgi:hypothetical protein